jgi:hypothetical protein
MDKKIINEIFESSKKEKSLLGIWTYDDGDGFWSGYVIDYNEDFVQLQHYTQYGKPDGSIIEKIDNIESIDYNDDYANSLQYIIDNTIELDKEDEIIQSLPSKENWQFKYLSEHLNKDNRVVRITLKEDVTYCGFVTKIDQETVVMNLIGKLGEDQGYSMFKLVDISCVRINDIENRKRLLLSRRKSS